MKVSPDRATGRAVRPYLWGGAGLTAVYALIAYPVVVTAGWGLLIRLVVIGWTALVVAYWLQRRMSRSNERRSIPTRIDDTQP